MKNIIDRLTAILTAKGIKPALARMTAISHLQKAKVLKPGTTELTALGREHNAIPSKLRPEGSLSRPVKY